MGSISALCSCRFTTFFVGGNSPEKDTPEQMIGSGRAAKGEFEGD